MGFWSSVFSFALSVISTLTLSEVVTAVTVVLAISKILGLNENMDDAKELGDKALQAEEKGITPDKFDNYDEYLATIENFEVDPKRSSEISEEEKLKKYLAVRTTQISEKLGEGYTQLITEVAPKLSKELQFDKKVEEYLKVFNNDPEMLVKYFKGDNLSFNELTDVENKILKVEKKFNPDASNVSILNTLEKERERFRV